MQKKYKKAFILFEKHYKLVPLEVFSKSPYKTLVATLMSSRTNDDITLKAAKRLFSKAGSAKKLSLLKTKQIETLIYPVGFYKTKAKHIKKLAAILQNNFNSKIPKTREELITLPGVGRKTANLVLNRAFGIPAIAVDIHVHRISNLIGLVNTENPLQTELELMKTIPKSLWPNLNKLFVSIGRQFRSQKKLKEFLAKNGL